MIQIEAQPEDTAAASKVDEFVNRRTQSGSSEQAVAILVRNTVRQSINHINGSDYSPELTREREIRVLAFAEAAALASNNALSKEDIIQAARHYAIEER